MANVIHNLTEVGQEGISKNGERFLVVERIPEQAKIKFLDDFGAEIVRKLEQVREGSVRNPYEISVCGVGRIGICQATQKERKMWTRLIKKHSQGKLPHFNKRWLVLEYFLDDIKTLKDYDLFDTRSGVIIFCPFNRYDRLEHLKVYHSKAHTQGVVVVDLFDKSYEVYSSRFECAWETAYSDNTIFNYCKNQAERDGYKFYWASDYADLFFE